MHLLLLLLTTILGSGIATAVVTHYFTIKQAREQLLRAKLEELFLAVSSYCSHAADLHFPYILAMRGEISYDGANESFAEHTEPFQRHHENMEMLVNLYFPEHRELMNSLVGMLQKAEDIGEALKQKNPRKVSPEAAKEYSEALSRFIEIGKLLRRTLSETSAKLLRPLSFFERLRRATFRFGRRLSA